MERFENREVITENKPQCTAPQSLCVWKNNTEVRFDDKRKYILKTIKTEEKLSQKRNIRITLRIT